MRGYGIASLALIGLNPLIPGAWSGFEGLAAFIGAVACVSYGRRAVAPDRRRTWTLLLWALAVFIVSNLVLSVPYDPAVRAGRLLDAAAYVLLLVASLALIMRRGPDDLGGVIDAAIIALAAGSVLWLVVPHRLGADVSFAAQVDLFTVVFAMTGVLGALFRLVTAAAEPGGALWWLLGAVGLAISGNVVLAFTGHSPVLHACAIMLLIAATTAAGLFGLDPNGPRLVNPETAPPEQLSVGRLVFLGIALATIPVVIGTGELLTSGPAALLLGVEGTLVAALVMARIGLLSVQWARAEQSLEHEATHDPLTHLPNRRQFIDQLRIEVKEGARCVVLFCDLDDFKSINDRYGHDVGDDVLIEVGNRLRACVGARQLVSRFGGDEFAILLIDPAADRVQAVRDCIETQLRRPFDRAGDAAMGVSVGISFADDRDPEQVVRVADGAMYREKAAHGRDHPYRDDAHSRSRSRPA
jgi:diguanylate cyclase (GGDEF)-like protein